MHPNILRELGLSPLWQKRIGNRTNVTVANTKKESDSINADSITSNESVTNPKHKIEAPAESSANNAVQNVNDSKQLADKPNTAIDSANTTPAPIANEQPLQESPPPEVYTADENYTDAPFPSAGPGLSWDDLRDVVSKCERCALSKNRTNTVFGVGARDADIFFIGEGPGEAEDRLGEPFVGEAGKLLDAMLSSIGLVRGNGVYIANIVKCRPPNNRTPHVEEAQACMSYLHRQLSLVQPKLIVALGRVAATHLLKTTASIANLRQRLHEYNGTPLVVTYHPAYLLRNPADKSKSWADLLHLRRVAKGE